MTTYTYDGLNRVTPSKLQHGERGDDGADRELMFMTQIRLTERQRTGILLRVNVGTDYQERYTFDSTFRLSSTIRTIGSRTYTTSYSRNQASQTTQLTYPSSRAINMGHDSIGRLSQPIRTVKWADMAEQRDL